MAPITLFDKSFLQSLSIDESVWFDHFFLANICPIFYVETLADLKKSVRAGRTPEQEVGIIADKFPEMQGGPNVHHVSACMGELFGHAVPMTGQIMLAGGRPVKVGEQTGVVFEQSPEAEAFSRWQKGEFLEIERLYAHGWREMLDNLDLDEVASCFKKLGVNGKTCKTLKQAKDIADRVMHSTDKPYDIMHLALLFLNVDQQHYNEILHRWSIANYPPLSRYAPYLNYVCTVEIFFQVALAADLISTERASNRVDISYLFYLPFSMMFVSSDKLHRKCGSLFLRPNQQFVWGPDLKVGLKEINEYYLQFPKEEKEKGVMSFAGKPPKEGDYLVSKIWDYHFHGWRNKKEIDLSENKVGQDKLLAFTKRFAKAPVLSPEEVDFDITNPDSITKKQMVRKKKGSWFQIPKDFEPT